MPNSNPSSSSSSSSSSSHQQQTKSSSNIPYYRPYKIITKFLSTFLNLNNNNNNDDNNDGTANNNSSIHKKISVGLWSGDVYISNVNLEISAWNSLLFCNTNNLYLKKGTIGKLQLHVPWVQFCKGIKGLVSFNLNDIEIVIGYNTTTNTDYDSSSYRDDNEKITLHNKIDNNDESHNANSKYDEEEEESNNNNSANSSSSDMLSRFMQCIASSFVWWALVGLNINITNLHAMFENDDDDNQDDDNNVRIGLTTPTMSINDCFSSANKKEDNNDNDNGNNNRKDKDNKGDIEDDRNNNDNEVVLDVHYIQKQILLSNIGFYIQPLSQQQQQEKDYIINPMNLQTSNFKTLLKEEAKQQQQQ